MRLGNTGGKNKGKKYLKITGNEEITPANRAKADRFKNWFGRNYGRLQIELIAKNTYDEDILNDTFLRIYDKIIFGGLSIADNKAYFHRAFFTNYIQSNIKRQNIERVFVADDQAVDMLDEALEMLEEQQSKQKLYAEILQHVRDRFEDPDYLLFVAYTKLGNRKYEPICSHLNLSYDVVSGTIGRIKKSIRSNRQFIHTRKSM